MEKDIFQAGLPTEVGKECTEHADMDEVTRAQGVAEKTEYVNLTTAIDRLAAKVRNSLSADVAAMFDFDFSANIDYSGNTDIPKFAKSVKKAFCEKLEKAEKDATDFVRDYYSENSRNIMAAFFEAEIESGRLRKVDYEILQSVTEDGTVKITENRDAKDKEGNVVPKDESLNISYMDEIGRVKSANYRVEATHIPDHDFDSIIAAYKIAAKATNVNGRYDKANKPKAESTLSAAKKENNELRARIADMERRQAEQDAQMAEFLAWKRSQQSK